MKTFYAILAFISIMGTSFLLTYLGAIHFADYTEFKQWFELASTLMIAVSIIMPIIIFSK